MMLPGKSTGRKDYFFLGGDRVSRGCSEEVIFELAQLGKLFQAGRNVIKGMYTFGVLGAT